MAGPPVWSGTKPRHPQAALLTSGRPEEPLRRPPAEGQTLAAGDPNPWTERYAAPLLRPFTQLQGSPLQHSLQLLPGAARHGPGQAGALLQDHLLPGHLLGHELAGEARRAEHHQVVRPLLGHHDERTASRSPGRAESTAPASHAATPVPRAATASSVAAAGTPRSRRLARAAAQGPRPRPRPRLRLGRSGGHCTKKELAAIPGVWRDPAARELLSKRHGQGVFAKSGQVEGEWVLGPRDLGTPFMVVTALRLPGEAAPRAILPLSWEAREILQMQKKEVS